MGRERPFLKGSGQRAKDLRRQRRSGGRVKNPAGHRSSNTPHTEHHTKTAKKHRRHLQYDLSTVKNSKSKKIFNQRPSLILHKVKLALGYTIRQEMHNQQFSLLCLPLKADLTVQTLTHQSSPDSW